jgi:hypothetical protein
MCPHNQNPRRPQSLSLGLPLHSFVSRCDLYAVAQPSAERAKRRNTFTKEVSR